MKLARLKLFFLITLASSLLVFFFIAKNNYQDIFSDSKVYASSSLRPYAENSSWNTLIGENPVYNPDSALHVSALQGYFGSDPTQFTMPVYEVSSSTPLKTMKISGTFSNVTENGTKNTNQRGGTINVPIPAGALSAKGTDSQIVIWQVDTGDEWGFWKAFPNSDGTWSATNGYHYNTKWSGVPPTGFVSRGAGVPYLTGLIRPWEMAQGHIDHAIAFAYDYPTKEFIYPATKSDGSGVFPDMPEGARLQLDPNLTDADFIKWGLTEEGKIIARALQKYGMIVIDKSGHPKIYAEYEGTAKWGGKITSGTVSKIPYTSFKVVSALGTTSSTSPSSSPTPTPTPIPVPEPTPTPVSTSDTTSPTISINSLTQNSSVTANSKVSISVNATDNVGVVKVRFYVNGSLKCEDLTAPFVCDWLVPTGSNITYNLKTEAFDASNNSAVARVKVVSK